MALDSAPCLVRALYQFKGSNNDELNFEKGDVITITQMLEGGWWEGTLKGVTGWFPSNYVKEYKADQSGGRGSPSESKPPEVNRQESIKLYRSVVLKDIIESEKSHVNDLGNLYKSFLTLLEREEILPEDEFAKLTGNLNEVIDNHKKMLKALEECAEMPGNQQRVGGEFMQMAPQLRVVHLSYCANHPKAVSVLEKYRDELNAFMESHGSSIPGIRTLAMGLSKPFRRLEKYRGLLQEMERHIEESHSDRGDIQRAMSVYQDLASDCSNIRRLKEMEMEVLRGNIRGWEGEEVQKFGNIIHMSLVSVITENKERHEWYLVLFPNTILLLSITPGMSSFSYEGKLPLSGITVTRLNDSDDIKNAFEITGNMIARMVVRCPSSEEQIKWLELLNQQTRVSWSSGSQPNKAIPAPAHHSPFSGAVGAPELKPQPPSNKVPYRPPNQVWTLTCLRPSPPLRPCVTVPNSKDDTGTRGTPISRQYRKKDERLHDDDAYILRVIEAYCTSAKTRYTVNSAILDSPQVLIAAEEKIINEVTKGNQTIVEEKSLVDTVYALKDQLYDLQKEMTVLAKALEEEQKTRKRLQDIVRKYLLAEKEDINWDD